MNTPPGMYRDPDGNPLTTLEWGRLYARRAEDMGAESWWRRWTVVGGLEISTVWLGLNHSFGVGPGLYWETIVFGAQPEYCRRYATRAEAFDAHEEIVRAVRAGKELAHV